MEIVSSLKRQEAPHTQRTLWSCVHPGALQGHTTGEYQFPKQHEFIPREPRKPRPYAAFSALRHAESVTRISGKTWGLATQNSCPRVSGLASGHLPP